MQLTISQLTIVEQLETDVCYLLASTITGMDGAYDMVPTRMTHLVGYFTGEELMVAVGGENA